MAQFERPKGAVRDVKELEFLACLHQTCDETRVDGSIVADDIVSLLLSRHGIEISKETAEQQILTDLVGKPDKFPDPVMDIRQMVSLLTIPYLIRASKSKKCKTDPVLQDLRKSMGVTYSARRKTKIDPIFETVLRIILDDALEGFGRNTITDEEWPILDTALLRRIFSNIDEIQVDDSLIQKMIHKAHASSKTLGNPLRLDPHTFMHALTSDVTIYNPDWERKLSTFYDDAHVETTVRSRRTGKTFKQGQTGRLSSRRKKGALEDPLKRRGTLSMIDLDADTYESQAYLVVLVFGSTAFFIGYYSLFRPSSLMACNSESFGCVIGRLVADWLAVLLQLSVLGSLIIWLASLGNDAYHTKTASTFIKVVLTSVMVPLLAVLTQVSFLNFGKRNDERAVWAQYALFLLAIMLLAIQAGQLLSILMPDVQIKSKMLSSWLFSSGYTERDSKKAAVFKINKMIRHALALHHPVREFEQFQEEEMPLIRSRVANAVMQFRDLVVEKEIVGGLVWTWKKYWSGNLGSKEGIFLGARFTITAIVQWLVLVGFVAFIVFAIINTPDVSVEMQAQIDALDRSRSVYTNASGSFMLYDDSVDPMHLVENDLVYRYTFDSVNSTYCTHPGTYFLRALLESMVTPAFFDQALLNDGAAGSAMTIAEAVRNATGIDLRATLVDQTTILNVFDFNFLSVMSSEIKRRASPAVIIPSLITGGICGGLTILAIAVNHVPAYISTVLKFRSGVLGSLQDSRFIYLNRFNPFFTTLLIGGTFWGTILSGGGAALICGGIVFLFLWEETKTIAWSLLAVVLVFVLTWLIRWAIQNSIYAILSTSFLRQRPLASNLVSLAFEAWNIGNSIGYIFARTFRILFIALLYVGRLDRWILAEGVGEVMCFHPDVYPRAFNRDLCVHEIHRHPYAERLTLMYMLKVRFGNAFGSRAGGSWRLIFVSALMPWLIRYKVSQLPRGIRRAVKVRASALFGDESLIGSELLGDGVYDIQEPTSSATGAVVSERASAALSVALGSSEEPPSSVRPILKSTPSSRRDLSHTDYNATGYRQSVRNIYGWGEDPRHSARPGTTRDHQGWLNRERQSQRSLEKSFAARRSTRRFMGITVYESSEEEDSSSTDSDSSSSEDSSSDDSDEHSGSSDRNDSDASEVSRDPSSHREESSSPPDSYSSDYSTDDDEDEDIDEDNEDDDDEAHDIGNDVEEGDVGTEDEEDDDEAATLQDIEQVGGSRLRQSHGLASDTTRARLNVSSSIFRQPQRSAGLLSASPKRSKTAKSKSKK